MVFFPPLPHNRQQHSLQGKVILPLAAPHLLHISKLYTYSSEVSHRNTKWDLSHERIQRGRPWKRLPALQQSTNREHLRLQLSPFVHLVYGYFILSHWLAGFALPLHSQEMPIIFSLLHYCLIVSIKTKKHTKIALYLYISLTSFPHS